jgi:hypothetical protein
MFAHNILGSYKNRMLVRRLREYSRAKVCWKIRIPGRTNQGMPRSRGWTTNPNTPDRSRDGPRLCPASPSTEPSTQVSVRRFNELNYSQTLETLDDKHPT